MNIKFLFLSVAVMVTLPSLAAGQGRSELDEGQLPPGKTKAQVQSMLEEIDRKTAQEAQKELAALERQDEKLNRILKKYEDRLAKAVERDPELSALRDKLEAGAQALTDPQLNDQERDASLERLAPDRAQFRLKALAKAGIDERQVNAEIMREFNNGVATRSGDATESSSERLIEKEGALYFVDPNAETTPESEVITRGTVTETLGNPWPWSLSSRQVDCTTYYPCEVDKDRGRYQVSALGHGVRGQNYMGLAQFRRVKSGDRSFRISARLPESRYFISARASLFGGARIRTWSKIEVWDESSNRLCRNVRLHRDLVAKWGQDLSASGYDTVTLSCEFTAPPTNHDLVIRFISGIYVSGAFQAWTWGYLKAQPRDVALYVTR
jgi:hypothetical protein